MGERSVVYGTRTHLNLRTYAKGKGCILCGRDDGTTVLAHFNIAGLFGMALKANDLIAAWLCRGCHTYVDEKERGDWRTKFLALARQLIWYQKIGILSIHDPIERRMEDVVQLQPKRK